MTGRQLKVILKNLRLRGKKIVFTQLATQLQMTPQSFNSKLNGKKIDVDFLNKISNILGVSLQKLDETLLIVEADNLDLSNERNTIKAQILEIQKVQTVLLDTVSEIQYQLQLIKSKLTNKDQFS